MEGHAIFVAFWYIVVVWWLIFALAVAALIHVRLMTT